MIKYRPEIDGLRSVAVIPVILFHLGYSWVSGGYFGVDVFFVISGFLITSIIVKDLKAGTFSMVNFWVRRVKRIMPALVVMVLITLMVTPFLIFKGDIQAVSLDAFAAVFSYANFNAWAKFGDYWGTTAENSFFLHAWSLSVEEQFYVIYPTFLFLLYKFRLSIPIWVGMTILLSLILFVIGSVGYPTATFYLLPTRAWEMACGGLIAVWNPKEILIKKSVVFRTVLCSIGLLLILVSYFVPNTSEGINLIATLPVFGAVLLISVSSEDDVIGKLLSAKPMVFIGKISYSLYLWHWPVIVLLNKYYALRLSNVETTVAAITITVIMSLCSYYFVENRTRKSKYTLKFVFSIVLVIIALGLFLMSSLFNKEYQSPFNKLSFFGLYYDITPRISPTSDANKAKRKGIVAPKRDDAFREAYSNGGMKFGDSISYPEIVMMGDSHGAMWAHVIHEISEQNKANISFYTSVGSSPFFNLNLNENQNDEKRFSNEERAKYAENFKNSLLKWRPKILIIACRWEIIEGVDRENFIELLELAGKEDINVLIINQPPVIDIIGNKNTAQYLTYLGYEPNEHGQYIKLLDKSHVVKSNIQLQRLIDNYSNVDLFDVYSRFAVDDKALVIEKGDILYYDDDHLSYEGTLVVKNELDSYIKIALSLE